MRHFLFVILSAALLSACAWTNPQPCAQPRTGTWRMELSMQDRILPFSFVLSRGDSGSWNMVVHNGTEHIPVDDVRLDHDTLVARMPLYDSEFRGLVRNDSLIEGHWHNFLKGPEYRIPFVAKAGLTHRFPGPSNGVARIAGTWEVRFSQGTPDAYNAIGQFEQHTDGRATGTFMTETGDYRFLEGQVHQDSLLLSCFDGSHAFLFAAQLVGDSLHGRFYSGTHWQEPWVAVRNPDFRLRDPDSLTFLREGHTMIDLRFPDTDGNMVSSTDERFRGKPLMVQIMGSWCPNCVDETRLLNELHAKYNQRGLEVLAVAFEKYDDPARAQQALKHYQSTLHVRYPILYGGSASKEEAARKLPFLDHVMSYPTCIFVGRDGKVKRIRTGFYGPGTGSHYEAYKSDLEDYIEGLINEGTATALVTP